VVTWSSACSAGPSVAGQERVDRRLALAQLAQQQVAVTEQPGEVGVLVG